MSASSGMDAGPSPPAEEEVSQTPLEARLPLLEGPDHPQGL